MLDSLGGISCCLSIFLWLAVRYFKSQQYPRLKSHLSLLSRHWNYIVYFSKCFQKECLCMLFGQSFRKFSLSGEQVLFVCVQSMVALKSVHCRGLFLGFLSGIFGQSSLQLCVIPVCVWICHSISESDVFLFSLVIIWSAFLSDRHLPVLWLVRFVMPTEDFCAYFFFLAGKALIVLRGNATIFDLAPHLFGY